MTYSNTYGRSKAPQWIDNMRCNLQELFSGKSTAGRSRTSISSRPKASELPRALPHIPRLQAIHIDCTSNRSSQVSPPIPETQISERLTLPRPSRQRSQRSFGRTGVDPEEQYLAELVTRRRRQKRTHDPNASKSGGFIQKLLPKVKERKVRRKIVLAAISGGLLAIILTIYLALALTHSEPQTFHVLFIITILTTTIFFCHSLISLCLLITIRSKSENNPNDYHQPDMSQFAHSGGFANPPQPIRVQLARDEEAVLGVSEMAKVQPPAYGLWRESVRVDPGRIFWQKNEEPSLHRLTRSDDDVEHEGRPPSFVSDDGVAYAVIATAGRPLLGERSIMEQEPRRCT